LHRPLVPRDRYRVYYVDHCDTEALKTRWASDATVDISALHVDAVWGQGTLLEALGAAGALESGPLDYVIASHVIEHVPDFIGWMKEVLEVLGPRGVLRLAVPDRRYTFDLLRRETVAAEVLSAWIRRRRVPDASRVLDFALNMVHVDVGQAWEGTLQRDALQRAFTDPQALALAEDAERHGTYHDVHCWVFTPGSFVGLMERLVALGVLDLACEWITPTARWQFEFMVSLRPERHRPLALASWRDPRVV
jgi:SAM-dependent methyltransferase